jgi:Subtilase family
MSSLDQPIPLNVMRLGNAPRQRAEICSIVALASACLLALLPASASAVANRAGDGELSPRLAALAKPAVHSAPPAAQAEELSLAASGPGSLLRRGNRVLVEGRFDHGAANEVGNLRAAGAKIVNVSPRYQTVTVAAKPAELSALSSIPHLAAATEVLAPIVHATGSAGPVTAATTPCFGAATSEGDEQLRAAQARAEFEVDGSGVKVGILSDSFNQDGSAATRQAEDVASGDLPGPGNPCGWTTPVSILEDFSDPEAADEGRGMAQIVHDLAPGASLSFATAFTGITAFADNIKALATAGAKVIADDISYFEEPFFQEGPVGVAVREVTEGGVNYFSSAGNNNLINGGRDIASWEAPQYRDSSGCPAALVGLSESLEDEGESGLEPTHCMDFNPSVGIDRTFRITLLKDETLIVDLQWAEPWEGVADDIDAYLLGPEGAVVAGSIEDNIAGSQQPFELVAWENETGAAANVQLVVNRYSGANDPRLKIALLQNGGGVTSTEYESSAGEDVVGPTIFGHNGAADAMSVGAIRYSATEAPEIFSSRGPVTHYFAPVNGVSPATELPSPETLLKPDVVATDGGANTFFGSCSGDAWRFFGTSAAAPHAAAVAALERDAAPAAEATAVNNAQRDGASTVGAFPPAAVGAGMIDAVAAIEELGVSPPAPGALPEPPPAPISCTSVEPEPEPEPKPKPLPTPQPPGNSGGGPTAKQNSNGVDRTAPSTFFRQRPAAIVRTAGRTARAAFRFGSNESGVSFLCKFDRSAFRLCRARTVRSFGLGRHVLRVKARDAAGNTDDTPAVYRFRVKRVEHP